MICRPNGFKLAMSGCGASLIHPIWILTAAHCFKKEKMVPPQMFVDGWVRAYISTEKVVPGFSDKEFLRQYVDEAYIHPNYVYEKTELGERTQNDVAVAKLKNPFEKPIDTITLHEGGYPEICKVGTIIGKGVVNFEGKIPKLVQYSPIRIKTEDQLSMQLDITDHRAFYSEVGWFEGHPLQGDSGGPFICEDRGYYPIQYGIISRDITVNETRIVISIYENVEHYMWFIRRYVPLEYLRKKAHRVKKKHQNDTKHPEQEVKSVIEDIDGTKQREQENPSLINQAI
ncbi:hypothetical protein ILUMI_19564 [Ignelater luminosus]|uniref:Peptidase S1 domain-containing protein n=1 Tax=Ignelater luminosus TaxID=2038154 RepID=A0A8K0CHZ3_IGNLU|nr:hypothetical protein ILUMI_19564 [Ignelater luminosus]